MTGLEILTSVEVVGVVLLATRVTALVWSAPIFSSRVLPMHL